MANVQDSVEAAPRGWAALAPALRIRNYRLYWIGLIISVVGTYLQFLAEGWLIYDLTGSEFMLGVLGFIGLLPVLPISFLGGLIIDRVPRRRLIMLTQTGLLLQAMVFGLLVILGWIRVWHIIVLDFSLGALAAIDLPARQAFLVELVEKEDLPNAVALNATTASLSRVVGYVGAGVLIAAIGAGGTMILNALTYLAPIIALSLVRIRDVSHDQARPSLGIALSEGLVALWKQPTLIGAMALMTIVGGLGSAVYLLMPAYAESVLQTDAVGLGLLMGAAGLGALLGSFVVAKVGGSQRGRVLVATSLLLPLMMVAVAFSRSMWVSLLFLLIHGMILITLHAMANTLVQLNVADRIRGRVMSIYAMLNAAGPRVSSVLLGALAEPLGLPLTYVIGGALAILFSLGVFSLVRSMLRLD